MNEERVLQLIGCVYEAAVDPGLWAAFLERLADAVHGGWTMLLAHDSRAWQASISLSVGADPAMLARAQELMPKNPFIARGRPSMRAGAVVTGEMLISDRELIRTETYNEILRPNNLHHMIGDPVTFDRYGATLISSLRSKRQGPFGPSEIRLFEALDPHLRRALQIQQKLAVTEGQHEALDRIPAGCVLLNSGGRILAANRAAEEIFRRKDGISTFAGQLSAVPASANAKLRDLVHAVTFRLPMPRSGGAVAIPRSNARQPYSVLVAPLPKRPVDWGGCSPVAIAFITHPTPPSKMEFVLQALYRLTRAEARLATALANGQGLGHAAEELGIARNTAKTQLQQIFAKTHTDRQAELVRLLTTVAWNTNPEEFSDGVIRSGDDI
jgi:DNA-binding CsgD family transcriptional regulator/PAS domain-containing protein